MNGVTDRMGTNQHLIRSIMPDPILVGRNEIKLEKLAKAHGVARWSTNLEECLRDPYNTIYFDAQLTQQRSHAMKQAIAAGKHVYCEKPIAETFSDAWELAKLAQAQGIKHGVVQDKLFLPGLIKLKRLIDADFFGRILSIRMEFSYWVFEGDWFPAQRPAWNYRKEDGGGIIVQANSTWTVRVNRDDLLTNILSKLQIHDRHDSFSIPKSVDFIAHKTTTELNIKLHSLKQGFQEDR